MDLEQQVLEASRQISTDSYSMSVGEFISMYKGGEVEIHPDFQRFFRWSDFQKSRFIESLLLGLPVPPLFVAQNADSTWDLVDGLQRASTILQLTGDLKTREKTLADPLVLTATRYLPELKDKVWNSPDDPTLELSSEIKLRIRRARLDVKIVLSKSDPENKFELFDRLNTGGSVATEQEVRNCMLIMANRNFFTELYAMKNVAEFQNSLTLTEKQISEQYDVELIVRFMVLRHMDQVALSKMNDLNSTLTNSILQLAKDPNFDWATEREIFSNTFKTLNQLYGEDVFRRWDTKKGKHVGPFLLAAFEIFALGYAYNFEHDSVPANRADLETKYKAIWASNGASISSTGRRASSRLAETVELGRKYLTT